MLHQALNQTLSGQTASSPKLLSPTSSNPTASSPTSSNPTIAIVGAGFSGTMVAVHLLRHATTPLTIRLIDRRPQVGQGVAYSTSFNSHVLNVPAGKISAFPDMPNHFLDWVRSQTLDNALLGDESLGNKTMGNEPITAASFVSRKRYGQYIQAILAEALALAPTGTSFEHIVDEVEAIYPSTYSSACSSTYSSTYSSTHSSHIGAFNLGAIVVLQSQRMLAADRVVLALGNFAPSDPPIANTEFHNNPYYVSYAWSEYAIKAVNPDDSILLIGSGLTMLDWVVALHERGHRGQIYAVSRRGLLPQPHETAASYPPFLDREPIPSTALALFKRVRQEVQTATAQGHNWRSVIDAIRPHTQTIWRSLSLVERRRFIRHIRPYWEVHRHRVAPSVASTITKLLQSGQLHLYAGRIQAIDHGKAISPGKKAVSVTIRPRNSQALLTLNVGTVVNCTGPECNYRKFSHPLITQLIQMGLIQPDILGLGLEVAENGALVDQQGAVSNWLYTIGSPRKGQLWETTAVPELRMQAIALAQELLTDKASPLESRNPNYSAEMILAKS